MDLVRFIGSSFLFGILRFAQDDRVVFLKETLRRLIGAPQGSYPQSVPLSS